MISIETFKFLSELKRNNSKEWFDLNRLKYEKSKKEFEQLVNHTIAEIAHFDKEASQTTSKSSIFRINRDIRFSNDKSPYKTNFGAYIAKGGRKSINAGYYIHIEPGESFLSGGIYMPSGNILKRLRTEIFENIDEFKGIITDPEFVTHFGTSLWGEKLKSAPQGFPRNFKDLELLKYKHYTVVKFEKDSIYQNKSLINEIKSVFYTVSKFNAFLNRAIDNIE